MPYSALLRGDQEFSVLRAKDRFDVAKLLRTGFDASMGDDGDVRAAVKALVQDAYDAYVAAGEHHDRTTGAKLDSSEEIAKQQERLRGCASHLDRAIKMLNSHPEHHLAEVIVRIADAAGALGFDLAGAVEKRTATLRRTP